MQVFMSYFLYTALDILCGGKLKDGGLDLVTLS